jgi:hypothetical protein
LQLSWKTWKTLEDGQLGRNMWCIFK